MTVDAITSEIFIDAPVQTVWELVTRPENLNQWWTDDAEFDFAPGGTGHFGWVDKGTAHRDSTPITIESIVEFRFFSYRWVYEPGAVPGEGNSMLVEFTFEARDGGTLFRVEESGLESMPWSASDKASFVGDHENGWTFHLGTLRDVALSRATSN